MRALLIHPSSSSLVQCDNCTSTDYNRILSLPIERIAHKEIHVVTAETCYIRHDYRRIAFANAIMRIQPIHTVQLATGGLVRTFGRGVSIWSDAMRLDLIRLVGSQAEPTTHTKQGRWGPSLGISDFYPELIMLVLRHFCQSVFVYKSNALRWPVITSLVETSVSSLAPAVISARI